MQMSGQYRAKLAGDRLACVESMDQPRKGRCAPSCAGMCRGTVETQAPRPLPGATNEMIRLIGWAGNMTLSNGFLQGILSA
jgi:hypothetical protein